MVNKLRKCVYPAAAVLLFSTASAFAQFTTPVTYTGTYGAASGVQTATIDGVDMTVISTDYADQNIASNFTWHASSQAVGSSSFTAANTTWDPELSDPVNGLMGTSGSSNVTNILGYNGALGFANTQEVYEAGAMIATQMAIGGPACDETCEAYDQAALFYLFDPNQGTIPDNFVQFVQSFVGQDPTLTDYSGVANVLVLTPGCTNGTVDPPCVPGSGVPEFLAISTPVVSTPESSESLILATNLLGLAGLAFLFRRRLIRVKSC